MANKKTTALTENTAPAYNDIIAMVDDPGGTPLSQKQTFKNSRKPFVTSEASSATPSINVDESEVHRITALAVAITSMTTNLTGTPYHGQKLIVEILDNGTARAITWGAKFRSTSQATLPTTTVISKLLRVGFFYDSVDTIWDCVAIAEEA